MEACIFSTLTTLKATGLLGDMVEGVIATMLKWLTIMDPIWNTQEKKFSWDPMNRNWLLWM